MELVRRALRVSRVHTSEAAADVQIAACLVTEPHGSGQIACHNASCAPTQLSVEIIDLVSAAQ
jgi:hypothetical protein